MKKLIPVVLLLLMSGCSHENEARNMIFVKTIGSDFSEGSFTAAAAIYDSEEVLSGSGKTIFSALENAESTSDKTLFSGHTELFIAGEGNFRESLEILIKNNRISPSCSFACTDEKAFDIASDSDNESLAGRIESANRNGLTLKRNISAVLDDLMGEDGMASAPIVNGDGIGAAVIDSESIKGVLTEDESKGLCWISEELHDIYLPVTTQNGVTDFLVRKSKPKLIAEADGDNINITVEIKINGSVQNEKDDGGDARRQAAEQISSLCSGAIAKTVTVYGADVFGLEKCVKASRISVNSQWKDVIPRLKFFYNIKIAD